MFCPVCNSNNISGKYSLYDDRYGFPDEYILYECNECNHGVIDGEFDIDTIKDLYTNYYPRKPGDINKNTPHKKDTVFNNWINGSKSHAYQWVPENVRILDIGCGYGQSLAYHKERGCEVYGIEVDTNIQQIADIYDINLHLGQFDPNIYENNFFDYVTLDQVLEHIADPLKLLSGIAKKIKPGGSVIISAPNANGWGSKVFGKRWINWHVPYHIHFYTDKSMQIIAGKAGLKIKDICTITPSDWIYYQWFHLLLYPEKGQPSLYWMHSNQLTIFQVKIRKILNVMHRIKINHLVTRFFDLLGIGDCKIYFLTK